MSEDKITAPPLHSKKDEDYELNRIKPLFNALLPTGETSIPWKHFCQVFRTFGLHIETDSRLAPLLSAWLADEKPKNLDLSLFSKLVHHSFSLIEKAIQGNLVIPEFSDFLTDLHAIFLENKDNNEGKVADYIPQLARVPADKHALSVCTIDGQRHSFGDSDDLFCVQSTCKPISYSLALEERGETEVHRHVGREPSGHSFNELSLNRLGLPHNPMINAGAIMTSAMIKPELSRADRFDHVLNMWSKLMGNQRPGFSNPTYLSERETADRNFALGYFMREKGAFPEGTNLIDTLEFYFQCCSLEVSCQMMSVLAATLANGGICPITQEKVLKPDTVQRCLSLMYSCGMYDFSGEWAFSVGLPAKSGICGAIMVVIPNVMGFCSWSPRLDENGNSIRGIDFFKKLSEKFNFHNFDNLLQNSQHQKTDPRRVRVEEKSQRNVNLLWACTTNEIGELRRLIAKGVNLTEPDYDGRTALHLAAAAGHLRVVKLLVSAGVPLNPKDRWGGCPMDDAKQGGHHDVHAWLEQQISLNTNNDQKMPEAT